MPNIALLNNVDHKDLRITTARSAAYGDNVNCAVTFPWEFRSIQADYPIFFSKDPETDELVPLAMFGFKNGENLFLDESGWNASYVPMTVERQPFLIGQDQTGNPVIHVDMDSPRIARDQGELVFLEHGGMSEYLERINSLLKTINDGIQVGKDFVSTLEEYGLLEPFSLDIELNDGSQNRLMGYFTINEQKVIDLDSDALDKLHRKSYLQAIYMVIASMSNIRDLITRQNARLES